jgi:ubiquitin C-terminal hydrolase
MEASKGHYVSWALDSSNQWILYDDNKVKKAPNGIDSVLNSQAYLLFYEKIVD